MTLSIAARAIVESIASPQLNSTSTIASLSQPSKSTKASLRRRPYEPRRKRPPQLAVSLISEIGPKRHLVRHNDVVAVRGEAEVGTCARNDAIDPEAALCDVQLPPLPIFLVVIRCFDGLI